MFTGHRAICPCCRNHLIVLREDDAEAPLLVAETLLPMGTLTPRETEVLQFVARGCSNSAIGAHLSIDASTVKTHVSSIIGKLGAQSRTGAVTEGMRRGLIQMTEGGGEP